jgi:hypothetical protein
VRALKSVDFEIAYLALLTLQGLKPLSRWEKALDGHGVELLHEVGLLTEQVRRTVKTGATVTETIFGISPGYIQLYKDRFADGPVDKSADAVRFEGFLFGFPPCCVDQFVRHPYVKNGLDPKVQKILFHWACPRCKITPSLLPAYRRIHEFAEQC